MRVCLCSSSHSLRKCCINTDVLRRKSREIRRGGMCNVLKIDVWNPLKAAVDHDGFGNSTLCDDAAGLRSDAWMTHTGLDCLLSADSKVGGETATIHV